MHISLLMLEHSGIQERYLSKDPLKNMEQHTKADVRATAA